MADKKKMSVDEILAACRTGDGAGGASAAGGGSAAANEGGAAEAGTGAEKSAAVPASSKDPKKMSVEEMLAAARGEKAQAAPSQPAESPDQPAGAAGGGASGSPSAKDPKKMSVEEMLAAARGEKAKPAAAKPAAAKSGGAPAKPAQASPAKPAPAKASSPAAASGPKDTASILAAARKSHKPGPVSKAEAAAKGKSVRPAAAAKVAPPMPAKPAYAMPTPSASAPAGDRRGFFADVAGVFVGSSLAVGFTSLAITHLLWVLGLARYIFPNILTEPPTRFKVGFPDDFAPGQVETKFKAQFGVWIARYEYEGQPMIYALKSVCTHLGCTPNWLEGEQKFKCPCHGSGFYKDGVNFEGPAPRPLERYAIKVADDGQLEVDKSRKFQEELGQWSDPASYVTV